MVYNIDEGYQQLYTGIGWVSLNTTCWPQPTQANAGADQYFTDGTVSTTLAANTPIHGEGKWSIISGEGGSFVDDTDPITNFTGKLQETYQIEWRISTTCGETSDKLYIAFSEYMSGEDITDEDGNIYNTVQIGSQLWMAENLKTTKYNDGTDIPNITNDSGWENLSSGAYCWYDNDLNNGTTYGALYNWHAVNTGKLCPTGWHVATDAEWTELTDYLGGESDAGGKLKETGTTHWTSPNTGATNETGFTALPGGRRNSNGTFFNIGYDGYWWSATEYATNSAWYRNVYYVGSNVGRYNNGKELGFSVRCVRD